MKEKKICLLAVHPFNGIEKTVMKIRQAVFRQTGFASALALPPIIPLCYLPPVLNVNVAREVLLQSRARGEFRLTGIRQTGPVLCLATTSTWNTEKAVVRLQEAILSAGRNPAGRALAAEGLFPLVDGFFLAVNQTGADTGQLVSLAPPGDAVVFNSFRFVLLMIRVFSDIDAWWQNLEWEIAVSVKKKSR